MPPLGLHGRLQLELMNHQLAIEVDDLLMPKFQVRSGMMQCHLALDDLT